MSAAIATPEVLAAWMERGKLWEEGYKLRAEGEKLLAEGTKLWMESNKMLLAAMVAVYGDIDIEWKNWNEEHQSYECHLSNGVVLGFPT